jgi:hypothetical protein
MLSGSQFEGRFLITPSLSPAWAIGTVGYYQTGVWGAPMGLLLSLTMTPIFKKMLMTDHGLRMVF